MSVRSLAFAFIWMFIACQSNSASSALHNNDGNKTPAAQPVRDLNTAKQDTIWIEGRYLSGCTFPATIRIAEHNELYAPWQQVPVKNGEFKYALPLSEPRRIALRTENRGNFDFLATPAEKTYRIEINCSGQYEKIDLKGSAEEAAYRRFSNANKKLRSEIEKITKNDLSKPEVFQQLRNTFLEYQKTLDGIIAAYPQSFTATFFCAAEKLPEESYTSLELLRKNYLNRDVFANPYLYNDFIGQRIITNYVSLRDKTADPYPVVDRLLQTAAQNPEASRRLQQVLYNIFYYRHEEDLITAYVKWADAYPRLMYNASVKMQLQRLEQVIAGKPIIDFQLNDPSGRSRRLSEVVQSSRLTLLIFYSPTCSHCQEELPQIVPLWQANKNKGLKIFCVGFDATDPEWKWFIENKASPEWVHVFETDQNYPPSASYVVNYTPTFILISPDGKIISRFADIDYVKNTLPKLLN
ncbi:MAG: hypothetical protein KatS3mg031_2408 [Chitinophagales bacterium]|nr:MAG: hypothetical protein KatS3mg031_2408 [Chitinophagales bacterium]